MAQADSGLIVLDTNTIMALWVFEDPKLALLRQAIDEQSIKLASSPAALEELRRVLAYRQFAIAAQRQSDLLARYTDRCKVFNTRTDPALPNHPALPKCADQDDQKFLELARDALASHLLTRDKLLLKLNRHRLIRPLFTVLTPEAFQLLL